jgi:hypothetical protein
MNNKRSIITNRKPKIKYHQERSTTQTTIRVIAFATSNPDTSSERAYIELEFLTRRSEWKREIIPASLLNRPSEFKQYMADKGYQWSSDAKQVKQILETLVDARPRRHFVISFVPGWHDGSFVLPDRSYVQKGAKHRQDRVRIMPKATVKLGEFIRSGSIDEWIEHVAGPCTHSSRAVLLICSAFAAPNLRPLGINSFGIICMAEHRPGKLLFCGVRLPYLD